jgi:hypothetical protein
LFVNDKILRYSKYFANRFFDRNNAIRDIKKRIPVVAIRILKPSDDRVPDIRKMTENRRKPSKPYINEQIPHASIVRFILLVNESRTLLMIGNRMNMIINTGKFPANIAGKASMKKYHLIGINKFCMKIKIKAPASNNSEEMNHILAARVMVGKIANIKVL